jgi:hypothetical protein
MEASEHYELQFVSDDKSSSATTVIEGTFAQVLARAQDVIRRRKANDIVGQHVLLCPNGRQIPIE